MENSNLSKYIAAGIIALALLVGGVGIFVILKPSEENSSSISEEIEEENLDELTEVDEPEKVAEPAPDEEDCETILAYRFESNDSSMDEKVLECEEKLATLNEEDWESDEEVLEEDEELPEDYDDSEFWTLFNENESEDE